MTREMRIGWELSERFIDLSYGQAVTRGYLEYLPLPCMIVDEELVVASANTLALQEFGRHVPLSSPLAVAAPLSMYVCPLEQSLEALRVQLVSNREPGAVVTVASALAGFTIQVSQIALAQDAVGKRRAQFLIVARPEPAPQAGYLRTPRIWETDGLTKQQAAVVRWIAEGGVVPDFASQNGITKKTAYDHLLAARQKLGNIAARDIYTSHQALLMIERDASDTPVK